MQSLSFFISSCGFLLVLVPLNFVLHSLNFSFPAVGMSLFVLPCNWSSQGSSGQLHSSRWVTRPSEAHWGVNKLDTLRHKTLWRPSAN